MAELMSPAPLPDTPSPGPMAGSSVRKRTHSSSQSTTSTTTNSRGSVALRELRTTRTTTTGRPLKINYPKKRVSVACEVCRARKTRCDARRPACSFCSQLNIDCVYRRYAGAAAPGEESETGAEDAASTERTPTQAPANDRQSKADIVARLGRLESLIRERDALAPATPSPAPILSPAPIALSSTDNVPAASPSEPSPSAPFSVASYGSPPVHPTHGYHHHHHHHHNSLSYPPPQESPFVGSTTSDRDVGPMPLFGYRLDSLSRLGPEAASLPSLSALCSLDVDVELETELFGEETAAIGLLQGCPDGVPDGQGGFEKLDLGTRRCWYLEQAFSRDVLPWCPIIEQQECAEIVARAAEGGFPRNEIGTAVALLVLALGSFAREGGKEKDGMNRLPGIDYFHAGRRVVQLVAERDSTSRYSIVRVQCDVLVTFYFLFSLKPILAFEVLSGAGLRLLMLLQLRSRRRATQPRALPPGAADPAYDEKLHRAYWTCYLLEHELQAHVSFSARLLQERRDFVPLPLSNYEEPGMYWFLSEIALRGICSSMQDPGVAWTEHMLDAPMLVEEVALQLLSWHSNLAMQVKFPLDDPAIVVSTVAPGDLIALRPLLDPHKVFLRAQFYAMQATLRWPFVVQLLTGATQGQGLVASASSPNPSVSSAAAAAASLQYAVLHVYAVEPLLQDRHLMLFANLAGLFCVTMLLLCAYGLPELQIAGAENNIRIQLHPQITETAVRYALQSLRLWRHEPNINAMVTRVESLARSKGIVIDGI